MRPVEKPSELHRRLLGARIEPDCVAEQCFGFDVIVQADGGGAECRPHPAFENWDPVARFNGIKKIFEFLSNQQTIYEHGQIIRFVAFEVACNTRLALGRRDIPELEVESRDFHADRRILRRLSDRVLEPDQSGFRILILKAVIGAFNRVGFLGARRKKR